MKLKKNFALIGAASLLSMGGFYALAGNANAAVPTAPVVTSSTTAVVAPVADEGVSETSVVPDTDNVQEGDQSGANDVQGSADVSGAQDSTDTSEISGE